MKPNITVYSHKNIKPYTGFVYLWRDSETKMFYLGSHKGHPEDEYTGSGKYFGTAYKKHKHNFKRRIRLCHTF